MFNRYKYIDQQGEFAIQNFKYQGGSDSFLYKLLWSPLTEFIVENIFPSWLAPNLITLSGFIIVCIAAIIIQVKSWDYQTELPAWSLYLASFSVLLYQILDNADGKQARKTGSSSPLGMLFDHGCDTTMTWIIGLMMANALQLGNNDFMFMSLLLMTFIGFFFAMWTQYHLGVMRLGYINPIDEGLVLIELIFLISGIYGQYIWHIKLPWINLQMNQTLVIASLFLAIFQYVIFFIDVAKARGYVESISSLQLPLSITFVFLITAKYSPTHIINQSAYLYIYSFGFMWSKMIGHLQLAHIIDQVQKKYPIFIFLCLKQFNYWNQSWITFCLIQLSNIFSSFFNDKKCIIEEKILAYILLIVGLILYIHFIMSVSLQISSVLNIRIFSIGRIKQLPKHLFTEIQLQEKQGLQQIEETSQ